MCGQQKVAFGDLDDHHEKAYHHHLHHLQHHHPYHHHWDDDHLKPKWHHDDNLREGWRRWVRAWIEATFWWLFIIMTNLIGNYIDVSQWPWLWLTQYIAFHHICGLSQVPRLYLHHSQCQNFDQLVCDKNDRSKGDVHVGRPWCAYALAGQVSMRSKILFLATHHVHICVGVADINY